jgi:RNA-directed DNA polymerase
MTKRTDQPLATVPFAATPAKQPASVKEWANRAVWTDRMLEALPSGVRGGKWHAYFADRGLYSLYEAHGRLLQSLTG